MKSIFRHCFPLSKGANLCQCSSSHHIVYFLFIDAEEWVPPFGILNGSSRRVGYTYYVIGQLEQIARELYNVDDLGVDVLEERIEDDRFFHVTFQLWFDNSAVIPRPTACVGIPRETQCPHRLFPTTVNCCRPSLVTGATFFKVKFNAQTNSFTQSLNYLLTYFFPQKCLCSDYSLKVC